jgi:hypothetical protein
MVAPKIVQLELEPELVQGILDSADGRHVVSTTLKTDDRVIARVTDGIYRQPGSAIRELVSNAFDADATRVVIKTDAPRFERISVEDDGHGMSPDALANMLLHIGGSAKRSAHGASLGVTSDSDPTRSPGGRRLIGKIGIGLFSVSQLTHSFQIITKVKGDGYRTIATVAMRQYADEDHPPNSKGVSEFESGKVNVWREKASDIDAHGTSIILTSIRPQARDTLRSRETWSSIEQMELHHDSDEKTPIDPPRFHIGRVDKTEDNFSPFNGELWSLPWLKTDTPDVAFRKLVDSVWDEIGQSSPNPQLDRIFDYYLKMVWQLSLSIPLPYVDGHLFDLAPDNWAEAFLLSNLPKKGAAQKIEPNNGASLRQLAGLDEPVEEIGKFEVFFDDLKLVRPIKFTDLPTSNNAIKNPLVFIGKCREDFQKIPKELSGGPLEFEAYLFWNSKIAPVEHQGSLIRIHGASGTLFDSSFMGYQVAEISRLRQITCEIFVREGLDSALNIDRESFNSAHPHAVYLTRWLHGALRQLASAQKRLASEVRGQLREESSDAAVSEIQRVATEVWKSEMDDLGAEPPAVQLSLKGQDLLSVPRADTYIFDRSVVVSPSSRNKTVRSKIQNSILEEKLKAITQILASFGLLDSLSARKQEKLLKAIYQILEAPGE